MNATVYVEDALILHHDSHPADQYVMRLQAPKCARDAQPGSFVHLSCGPSLPMRRPFSIMRASPKDGWIDILYKCVGHGTQTLAQRLPGEKLSMMGPIGVPFHPLPDRPRALLIGGGVGIPPMLFLAERMRAGKSQQPLVLMGSEVPFPFPARPSRFMVPGMPADVIAAVPLMEDLGIPSRLASQQGYAGCYQGYVTDLARAHLQNLDARQRQQTAIYACGPHAMLAATARLAKEFDLPAQVSLEEYMACAIGGCAGCAVRITTENGPAMKRVCVDGPVFDAKQVFS